MTMSKSDVKKEYVKFLTMKNLDANMTQIDLNISALVEAGITGEQIVVALRRLAFKTKWFPDASEIMAEIRGTKQDSKDADGHFANELAQKIMNYVSNNSRDEYSKLKEELGQDVFDVVTGYSFTLTELSLLEYDVIGGETARLRDYLKARIKGGKIMETKFTGGQLKMEEKKSIENKPIQVDFNKFLPDNS